MCDIDRLADDYNAMRRERDEWKETSESWRLAHQRWQDWAKRVLDEHGRQLLYGEHGDEQARQILEQLVRLAPGVPRCVRCGCFSTRHKVDDEELRGCADCECDQFECDAANSSKNSCSSNSGEGEP